MNFKRKPKAEPPLIGNEYILLHTILLTLRSAGLTVTSIGSEQKRHPLYEFQIATAYMTFGTLAALVNEPNKFKNNENGVIESLNKRQTTIDEIKEIAFSLTEVSNAVDVLAGNNEVKKNLTGAWVNINQKSVELTQKGALRLYTNFYLKQFERETKAVELHTSTVDTNMWMKRFTGILALCALLTFIISGYGIYVEQTKPELLSAKDRQYIKTSSKLFLFYQKQMNDNLRSLADSVSSIKPTNLK